MGENVDGGIVLQHSPKSSSTNVHNTCMLCVHIYTVHAPHGTCSVFNFTQSMHNMVHALCSYLHSACTTRYMLCVHLYTEHAPHCTCCVHLYTVQAPHGTCSVFNFTQCKHHMVHAPCSSLHSACTTWYMLRVHLYTVHASHGTCSVFIFTQTMHHMVHAVHPR